MMVSRAFNVVLSFISIGVAVGAMAVFIYATVVWCVDCRAPSRLLWLGFGLGGFAALSMLFVPDKRRLWQVLRLLLLALLAEYALAGLAYLSEGLRQAVLWLHFPAGLLQSLFLSDGGRSTIRRDIAFVAITQWLLIALVAYSPSPEKLDTVL